MNADIMDEIEPEMEISVKKRDYKGYVIIALVVVVIILILYIWLSGKKEPMAVVPDRPPDRAPVEKNKDIANMAQDLREDFGEPEKPNTPVNTSGTIVPEKTVPENTEAENPENAEDN
jgi:hypothetical protein